MARSEDQAEPASPADLAVDLDLAVVGLHDVLHEEQTETVSTLAGGVLRSIEPFEDLLDVAARDADAPILHLEDGAAVARIEPDADDLRAPRVLGRVVHEVEHGDGDSV